MEREIETREAVGRRLRRASKYLACAALLLLGSVPARAQGGGGPTPAAAGDVASLDQTGGTSGAPLPKAQWKSGYTLVVVDPEFWCFLYWYVCSANCSIWWEEDSISWLICQYFCGKLHERCLERIGDSDAALQLSTAGAGPARLRGDAFVHAGTIGNVGQGSAWLVGPAGELVELPPGRSLEVGASGAPGVPGPVRVVEAGNGLGPASAVEALRATAPSSVPLDSARYVLTYGAGEIRIELGHVRHVDEWGLLYETEGGLVEYVDRSVSSVVLIDPPEPSAVRGRPIAFSGPQDGGAVQSLVVVPDGRLLVLLSTPRTSDSVLIDARGAASAFLPAVRGASVLLVVR